MTADEFARPGEFSSGMTRFWTWASLVLLLPAWQIEAAASRETSPPCPGAVAWQEAHRNQLPAALAQRDQTRTFSAPELRAELKRRLLAAGKPQRFGTQFDWYSGQFKSKGAGNIADIEANGHTLGLMPLADYACMTNKKLKHD
jgi:hypothetical protein